MVGDTGPDVDRKIRAQITAAIRELLDVTGMSQAQLGRELGLEPATICRALADQREWKPGEIGRLALMFKVPAGFFFGDDVEVKWLEEVRAARERDQRRHTVPLRSLAD